MYKAVVIYLANAHESLPQEIIYGTYKIHIFS